VLQVIATFRSNFPRDGNPVGTNAEITAALAGRNQLRLVLLPPDPPAINPAGDLCDRWGTPFFFHAESATKMEIRSAGPDQKMWTDDDLVAAPSSPPPCPTFSLCAFSCRICDSLSYTLPAHPYETPNRRIALLPALDGQSPGAPVVAKPQ
jgi:hypothetical protein